MSLFNDTSDVCFTLLLQFNSDSLGSVHTANLGLVGKMTGAAAITTSEYDWLHDGRVFLDTRVKALGVLGK